MSNGQSIEISITQVPSGPLRSVTWDSLYRFPGGTPITNTQTFNAIDIFTIVKINNKYFVSAIQNF
jgi:hypothetical protein